MPAIRSLAARRAPHRTPGRVRHPQADAIEALLWDGALAVRTPSPADPDRIDLGTIVQLDGDLVTVIRTPCLAAPAALEPALARHDAALARCRAELESELSRIAGSLGHLWIAGSGCAALLAGAWEAPAYAIVLLGPAARAAARRIAARLLRRAIRAYVLRLSGDRPAGGVAAPA